MSSHRFWLVYDKLFALRFSNYTRGGASKNFFGALQCYLRANYDLIFMKNMFDPQKLKHHKHVSFPGGFFHSQRCKPYFPGAYLESRDHNSVSWASITDKQSLLEHLPIGKILQTAGEKRSADESRNIRSSNISHGHLTRQTLDLKITS